jgi:8-oxo-dGTP diphosphatase
MSETPYRFCPCCGGPLAPRRLKTGDPERMTCAACHFVLYLDPKVAVGTIISTGDGRLVLVRRAIEPGYGLWVFPGGYVDRGEHIIEAAVREAREESGLDVRIDGLVNIYSYAGTTPIIVVYTATVLGGELCIDDECLEARLFAADEIPWDQLAFRSTRDALTDYYSGARPSWRGAGGKDSGLRSR